MRISSLMITAACILCCGTLRVRGVQAAQQGGQQRIQIQEQRLGEIEQAAACQREQAERWYADQQAELTREIREIARRAAIRINYNSRFLWVEFAKVQSGEPVPEVYLVPEFYWLGDLYGLPLSYETAVLRNAMIEDYLISDMADLLLNEEFGAKLAMIVDERWQAPALRRQATQLLNLSKEVQTEARRVLDNLGYRRAVRIESIAEWEKDLKEQVAQTLSFLRGTGARESAIGTVCAIGCSAANEWVAMIEGAGKDLRPGDTIRGIRVLDINPVRVRFSRNGVTWSQEIGAPAPAQWN